MIIEYNDFQLTDQQVADITESVGRRNLRAYLKENEARPTDIEPFFVLTDEEKEKYRRVQYARYLRSLEDEEAMTFSNGHTRSTVEPGDIVYYEGTPIGVVVITPSMAEDGIGRMMSLPVMSLRTPHTGSYYAWLHNSASAPEREIQFGLFTTDIDDLNKLSKSEARLDMDGKGNTAKIVAMHTIDDLSTCETISAGNDTNSAPAAASCYCFSTPGTQMGDWYLPAAGEWLMASQNRQKINYGIDDFVGGIPYPCDHDLVAIPLGDNSWTTGDTRNTWGGNFGQWYWSSSLSDYDTKYAWYFNTFNLNAGLDQRPKNTGNGYGVVKAFCHF